MKLLLRVNLKSCVAVFCVVLLGLLAACGGSDDNGTPAPPQVENDPPGTTPGGDPPVDEPAPSGILQARGTVQDIWTFESLNIVDIRGGTRDITASILNAYQDSLGEAVTVSGSASFREIAELSPEIQTSAGASRAHIDVIAGQMSYDDRDFLVVIATPDVSKGGLIAASDRLHLDITRLETEIAANMPVAANYFFAVSTPGDSPDQANNGVELLVERLQDGRFTLQTETAEPDSKPLLITGNIGTTVSGSLGVGLPAKSQPLICGLPTAPGGSCGIFCLADNLNNIYQGFNGSLTALDANFGPGTGSSPPPSNKCPAGSDCSSGGNDPHLRSFDGTSFSPQAVGEFDAVEYTGANQSVRTQFRFSAVPGNRTVSYITVAALEIDGTRITVAPNRENVLELDGQPITFDEMGEPQLNGMAFDNNAGIQLTQPRGGIHIAIPGWTWNFSFSGRGTGGIKFINFMMSVPGDADGIAGLLGNANSDPADDMQSRDGTFTLAPHQEPTVNAFYQQFVGTWRVTDETSLFDYAAGETTATYTDLTFPDFPNLTNGPDTNLSVAIVDASVDTTQAQAVCRLSGINAEPAFTECVTDVVNTGDFEIVNASQVLYGFDSILQENLFGSDIDGTDLRWWHVVEGGDFGRGGKLVVNQSISMVSTQLEDTNLLSAFDSDTGAPLWELRGVSRCEPVAVGNDRVVVQLGTASESNELALLDARNGTELDRIAPATGEYRECTDGLAVTSENRVILASRFARYGFSISNDTLVQDWTFDHETDPLTVGASPRGFDVVLADDLYFSALRDRVVVVFRVDTASGTAVAEFVTSLTQENSLQVAGDNLIVVGGSSMAFGITAEPNTAVMTEAWSREFTDTIADGVTGGFGTIAVGANGFASWTRQQQDTGSKTGIGEFNPQTGLLNWFTETSSFDNNDQVVALDGGGYAVSPFGSSNFVEAYNSQGEFAWAIPYPEGTNFPQGMASTGDNSIVVISRNDGNSDVSALVNIGTLR